MRETVIKCDLCLKDITEEEYIPRIRVKQKPKGGWAREGTNFWENMEICAECETKIFNTVLSLRVRGSPLRIYKENKEVETV